MSQCSERCKIRARPFLDLGKGRAVKTADRIEEVSARPTSSAHQVMLALVVGWAKV
jgi:hypothetical protein